MIVFGKQVALYLLNRHKHLIKDIYVSKQMPSNIFKSLKSASSHIIKIDAKKAQAMAKGRNHQGILLRVKDFELASFSDIKRSSVLAILCEVSDVGNIGSIIRSAYCLGIDGVIISGINNISYEGIARSSSGALFDIPVSIFKNILDLINNLKHLGFVIYGANVYGDNISNVSFGSKIAICLGNESLGLSKKVLSKMDRLISIPMKNDFNSLNISSAASIIFHKVML